MVLADDLVQPLRPQPIGEGGVLVRLRRIGRPGRGIIGEQICHGADLEQLRPEGNPPIAPATTVRLTPIISRYILDTLKRERLSWAGIAAAGAISSGFQNS